MTDANLASNIHKMRLRNRSSILTNTTNDAYKSVFHHLVKDCYHFKNRIKNSLYPVRLTSGFYFTTSFFLLNVFVIDMSFGKVKYIKSFIGSLKLESQREFILTNAIFSFVVWFVIAALRRWILCMLLYYHGWMYDSIGHTSLSTKVYMVTLRFFMGLGSESHLYSHQRLLPTLPLPKLNNTLNLYLKSVEPLLTKNEYIKLEKMANKFKYRHGLSIQLFLFFRYWFTPNYISYWWEKYVYLSNRSPLMINSNYYGMDTIQYQNKYHQSSRAANLVCASVAFMKAIQQETVKPMMINDLIPLCSRQYEQLFGTTRIPQMRGNGSLATDILMNTPYSEYIVVMCNGRNYKVNLRHRNRKWLKPVEMEYILNIILEDDVDITDEERFIPVLTSSDRNYWAETRLDFFSYDENKKSIEIFDKAAFILVLETYPADFDMKEGAKLNFYAKSLIAGDGYNRWFDKSFNLIVYSDGKAGFNAEHSWADAPIMSHFWEYILVEDAISPNYGYGADGHCRGICSGEVPIPLRIRWSICPNLLNRINKSLTDFTQLKDELDLVLVVFKDFGKGAIKKSRLSPDGFIQMALQFTYYKIHKTFCFTYEASMTRLFKEGRTETIRSCSPKSCQFVESLLDPKATDHERISLFRKAVDYHQQLLRDAMTGKGIDRHLFAMYVSAEMFKINDPFLEQVTSQPWQLSTSQTPNGQSGLLDLERFPQFMSAGGGFGPVSDSGYGVSYIILGEKMIFFHISSKFSHSKTCSKTFGDELRLSMKHLLNLIENKEHN